MKESFGDSRHEGYQFGSSLFVRECESSAKDCILIVTVMIGKIRSLCKVPNSWSDSREVESAKGDERFARRL